VAPKFFSRQISVTTKGEVKVPVSFRLDDREYAIADILDSWHDYGFGKSSAHRKRWWQRHHRSYFRVKTTEGEVFEIYFDRGTKLEHARRSMWFLSRQI
jgi:hypothetical protein